jgi:hypothetical protein
MNRKREQALDFVELTETEIDQVAGGYQWVSMAGGGALGAYGTYVTLKADGRTGRGLYAGTAMGGLAGAAASSGK